MNYSKYRLNSKHFLFILISLFYLSDVMAHHVLGRPAYNLNEDSNTPPSMTIETQIGDYFINAMVYPAFPRPNEPGRIHFYATHIDKNKSLDTSVTFSVSDDSWFKNDEEKLGAQVLDDVVYRQSFMFHNKGNYIITAEFEADGEPYRVDFPIRVGDAAPIGLLGGVVALILLILVTVSIVQRKKLIKNKIRNAHEERRS